VHGGIEPDDVFLKAATKNDKDNELEVIVSDFGMNRVGADAAAPGAQVGTGESFGSVRYMSPEQCRGQKPDARSDVYSLACLAFEMLTGEVVYAMGSQLEAMLSQAEMERDLLIERLRSSGVSEGTIELLSSMLARESKDRPADMKVVAARLKALWQAAPSGDAVSLGALLSESDLDSSRGEFEATGSIGRWFSVGIVAAGAVLLFAVLPALWLLFVELVGGASAPQPSPVQSREFQEKLKQARSLAAFLKISDSGPSTRHQFASIAREITSQLLHELQSADAERRAEAAALLARPVLRLRESNSFAQDVWILRQALTYLSEPRHYAALFDAASTESNSQARKQLLLVLGFIAANDDFASNYLLEAVDKGGHDALLPPQISAVYRESFPDRPMGNLEFGLLEILQTTSNEALIDSITESFMQPGGVDSSDCLDVLRTLQGHSNPKIALMAQQRLQAASALSGRKGQGH
jgi:serine/threonine protein kinase